MSNRFVCLFFVLISPSCALDCYECQGVDIGCQYMPELSNNTKISNCNTRDYYPSIVPNDFPIKPLQLAHNMTPKMLKVAAEEFGCIKIAFTNYTYRSCVKGYMENMNEFCDLKKSKEVTCSICQDDRCNYATANAGSLFIIMILTICMYI